MKKIKVYPMRNSSSKPVQNQYIIQTDEGTYFQSYSTTIAFISSDGTVYLDHSALNQSRTTTKYRNQFLRESTKETTEKVQKGVYKVTNLN